MKQSVPMTSITPMTRAGGLPHFSAEEYARRRAAVDGLADEHGVEALVLYGSQGADLGVQYLTGWPATREAWLVYRPGAEPALREANSSRSLASSHENSRFHRVLVGRRPMDVSG